jgi:hypothetical protein
VTEDAGAALDRIVQSGGDADDVLRQIVELIAAQTDVEWAGIAFVEDDALVLGPAAGVPNEAARGRTAILYRGSLVGELWIDGPVDERFVATAASAVSPFVLIGWDTQGQAWEP